MSNWAELSHAYGSAEDVPALLAAATPDPRAEAWNDLWNCLCHQGSVYSASAAALPQLRAIAQRWAPADRLAPLTLAGAIVSSRDPSADFDIAPHRADIAGLAALAIDAITTAPWSQADLIYLLQAVAGLQGQSLWGNQLDRLGDGESFASACPACGSELEIEVDDEQGRVRVEGGETGSAIVPIGVDALHGIGQQLHALACKAERHEVGVRLRHVFGHAPCPACGQRIAVNEAIAAGDA